MKQVLSCERLVCRRAGTACEALREAECSVLSGEIRVVRALAISRLSGQTLAYRQLCAISRYLEDNQPNFACRYFGNYPVLYAFANLIGDASENVNHESKLLKT